ncbi:MAG TPA: carboxypeptidase-like regulatory domain-containing protein, partial [Thermoanaerobaculia bacterium]
MIVPGQPSTASARLSSPVAEATFNKVGAVQLVGVPAGVYMLVVSAGGFADASAHPIEVDESRETILRRALRLEPPVTARVGVAPAVDPHGAPWRVSLKRRSDFTAGFDPLPDAATRTNTLGVAEIAGRNPGRYALVVEDSRGNDLFFDDWTIGHETAAERLVDLPLKEVRGTVTLDDEPVAAAVSFGGTHGVVRVEMTAGADGKFHGYLPRGGRWRVAVRNAGTRSATLLDVEVEEDGDVEIELPNTSVSGIVLDSRGDAVERARVTLLVPETALTARTDPAGRFTFDSVPLGRRTLSAVHADGSEASAQVEVEGSGVMGYTPSGSTWGVKGFNSSNFGKSGGVLGIAGNRVGSALSVGPIGVRGESYWDSGVLGLTVNGGGGVSGSYLDSQGNVLRSGHLGNTTYAVFAQGSFAATSTKSFVDPHPTEAGKVIRFISLEGPEAGTYFRGRGKFSRGKAVIEVPEAFRLVSEEEGMTVHVTPIGGLAMVAVIRQSLDRIDVESSKDVEFAYVVHGVRRGYRGFEPIAEGDEFTPKHGAETIPAYLNAEQKRRLIDNGTYNADGTV